LAGATTVTLTMTAETPDAGTPPLPSTGKEAVEPAVTGPVMPVLARESRTRAGGNETNEPGVPATGPCTAGTTDGRVVIAGVAAVALRFAELPGVVDVMVDSGVADGEPVADGDPLELLAGCSPVVGAGAGAVVAGEVVAVVAGWAGAACGVPDAGVGLADISPCVGGGAGAVMGGVSGVVAKVTRGGSADAADTTRTLLTTQPASRARTSGRSRIETPQAATAVGRAHDVVPDG
jgi:hypothetical protein